MMKNIDDKKKVFLIRVIIWWIFGFSCLMTIIWALSVFKIISYNSFVMPFFFFPVLMFSISWVMDEILKRIISKKGD